MSMHVAAVLTSLAAFASFSWGVLRFFQKPSGLTWRAGAVALLGLGFGAWQVQAIATARTGWGLVLAGAVLHVLSMTLFWGAIRACHSVRLTAIFETDAPVQLIRRGPYRCVRHPFYASYTLFWLAGWVASGSIVTLISVAVMLAFYLKGAREEERKFASSGLAADYAAYRRQVGLLCPKPRVLRAVIGR